MTLEARKFRAQDAKQLNENPMLVEAFKAIEAMLTSSALSCDPDHKEKAQRIIISLQLLAGIKREITRVINDGLIAEVQMSELEQKKNFSLKNVFRR